MITALLDPKDKKHTDRLHRTLALSLLQTILTTSGKYLKKWIDWGYVADNLPHGTPQNAVHISMDTPKPIVSVHTSEVAEEPSDSPVPTPVIDIHSEAYLHSLAISVKDLLTISIPRHIFQLITLSNTTSENPPTPYSFAFFQKCVFSVNELYGAYGSVLKNQMFWYIKFILTRLNTGVLSIVEEKLTTLGERDKRTQVIYPDIRAVLIESLYLLLKSPKFTELVFDNFDGDVKRDIELGDELIGALITSCYGDMTPGGPVTNYAHQVATIECLCEILESAAAFEGETVDLTAIKKRKGDLKEGVRRFNAKPKDGLAYLTEKGYLPAEPSSNDIAAFLKGVNVNKKVLGDYLAKLENIETLKAFIGGFEFKGRIDEALREMLTAFRLPGEAQLIERVIEVFSIKYFESMTSRPVSPKSEETLTEAEKEKTIASSDAAFVLAYSIIMLNTDQHNPQVRKRMTLQDFQRNTRGVNDGKDFPAEYMVCQFSHEFE